jgi:hypothetical protein
MLQDILPTNQIPNPYATHTPTKPPPTTQNTTHTPSNSSNLSKGQYIMANELKTTLSSLEMDADGNFNMTTLLQRFYSPNPMDMDDPSFNPIFLFNNSISTSSISSVDDTVDSMEQCPNDGKCSYCSMISFVDFIRTHPVNYVRPIHKTTETKPFQLSESSTHSPRLDSQQDFPTLTIKKLFTVMNNCNRRKSMSHKTNTMIENKLS